MTTLPMAEERADPDENRLGECRRYPPRMSITVHDGGLGEHHRTERPQDGGWPWTFSEDWCGEWAPLSLPVVRTDNNILGQPITTIIKRPRFANMVARAFGRRASDLTIGELIQASAYELLEEPEIGTLTMDAVHAALASVGLHLRGDDPPPA